MENSTTDTATGIHSPLTYHDELINLLVMTSNNWVKTVNVKTPNGIRSHLIYTPEKYAELCEAESI